MVYHPTKRASDGGLLYPIAFSSRMVCRQGGILSPLFFNVCMDDLSSSLSNTPTGCSIGGVMVNHIMYADDWVIRRVKDCNACWTLCTVFGKIHDILFNDNKTGCIYNIYAS